MPVVFGNNTSGSVTSGGRTAPSSGSTESWTVTSVVGFPTSLSTGQGFHVADSVFPTEKILVTAISGSGPYTWTVTRGDESTTPVAHAANFVVQQVVTAGEFTTLNNVTWYNVTQFGADSTGTNDSTTAIQNALTIAGNAGGNTVYCPAGTYKVGPLVLPNNVTLRGAGIDATTLLLNHSTVSQFGNMIMNQQLVGTSWDANCVQVHDMTLDGAKSAMSSGWWNCGIVLSNRTPSGGGEYTDGRHQCSNLLIQNFTGDGFVQSGRGVVQGSDIQVWACSGFGFNIGIDSYYTNCDAGGCGLDGWLIQGNNMLSNCKAWFSGSSLQSTRGTGATALTVTPPSANAWDGGSISGLVFSLANGFGNGFLWYNISGTATAGNYSGGSHSALNAQDNSRAGFCVIGGRQVLSAIEADSNNNCGVTSGTTGLGSYPGVDLGVSFNCYSNRIDGYSWDRQANTNRQAAALAIGPGNNGNIVRLGFEGKLNDNSNMPPLTAGSSAGYQNTFEFAASGAGSIEAPAYAASYTPDPFFGQVKSMTLTGAITVNNPALTGTNTTGTFLVAGMRLTLILTQDATGGRVVTLGAAYRLNGNAFSTTANATTSITFVYDGAYWQAPGLLPFLAANSVLLQGADPTGASFSDTALAAAKTALGSGPGNIVIATPGTYKFANSYTFGPSQGLVSMAGSGNLAVILSYTGNSVFIHTYDSAFNTSNTSPLPSPGGTFTGFTIDGTSAGSAAKAFQLGDQNLPNVNIGVRNFTGATAIGGWLCNQVGWTNYGSIVISTENCTNHVVFDNAGTGGATFGGTDFVFNQTVQPNQKGIIVQNACQPTGGNFQLYGGYLGGTTNSGRVLSIGEDGSNAGFRNMSSFVVNVEADSSSGTVGPVTIALGGSAYFMQNSGQLTFRNFSANFQASTGLAAYRFSFTGWIQSDTTDSVLGNPGTNGYGLVTQGGSLWTFGPTDATHIYLGGGDFFQTTLASGANTVAVASAGSGRPWRIIWHVIQPASGAAGTLTLTGAKTTAGSGALTLSAVNGETDVVEVWSLSGTTIYAAVKGLNFH